MGANHRLVALGISVAGGAAVAIWGHSIILDVVSGIVVCGIGLAVADAIRRRA